MASKNDRAGRRPLSNGYRMWLTSDPSRGASPIDRQRPIDRRWRACVASPDQLELLPGRSDQATDALDELLRFDTPVQITQRIATQDLDPAGTRSWRIARLSRCTLLVLARGCAYKRRSLAAASVAARSCAGAGQIQTWLRP